MAVVPANVACDPWPVAVEPAPVAVALWPVAVALAPLAFAVAPTAVPFAMSACELLPNAVDMIPVAEASAPNAEPSAPAFVAEPTAVESIPFALAFAPRAVEFAPTAVAPWALPRVVGTFGVIPTTFGVPATPVLSVPTNCAWAVPWLPQKAAIENNVAHMARRIIRKLLIITPNSLVFDSNNQLDSPRVRVFRSYQLQQKIHICRLSSSSGCYELRKTGGRHKKPVTVLGLALPFGDFGRSQLFAVKTRCVLPAEWMAVSCQIERLVIPGTAPRKRAEARL